jgi:hypothetical protein
MALTVRVTRDDGSVTFKGWYRGRIDAAVRERNAWLEAGRSAEVVDSRYHADQLKAWKSATRNGGRYFPAAVSA